MSIDTASSYSYTALDMVKVLIAIACFVVVYIAGNALFSTLLQFIVADSTAHLILADILALASAVAATIFALKTMTQSSK